MKNRQSIMAFPESHSKWINAARFQMLPERLPGSYVLVVRMDRTRRFCAGRLPQRVFAAGWYAYAGSALNGLKPRLSRYLNKERKRHWHIDYLLEHGIVDGARVSVGMNRLECRVAASLAECLETVAGFGCSDCRCNGHLFFSREEQHLKAAIAKAFFFSCGAGL
jgi:Uri superfamily endonuclease